MPFSTEPLSADEFEDFLAFEVLFLFFFLGFTFFGRYLRVLLINFFYTFIESFLTKTFLRAIDEIIDLFRVEIVKVIDRYEARVSLESEIKQGLVNVLIVERLLNAIFQFFFEFLDADWLLVLSGL